MLESAAPRAGDGIGIKASDGCRGKELRKARKENGEADLPDCFNA